jgi:hypothetical protein
MNYVVHARYGDDWPHQNHARALRAARIALYVKGFSLRSCMARAMLEYTGFGAPVVSGSPATALSVNAVSSSHVHV